MSRADELKVLTDSIERLAAMAPPLHVPYSEQPSWYAGQRRRTDALQAEITKLLSTPHEPEEACDERDRTIAIVRVVEGEANMDTEHGVGWSQACRSIENRITQA